MNLLVTDDTQNARSLLDRLNQKETISGIDVKSVNDTAREIVIHDLSSNGAFTAIKEPKRLACAYMIQTIMERLDQEGKLLYFRKGEKVIDDIDTCLEIYNKLNEIRTGKTMDAYAETDDPKITTLKAILKEFEKELEKENYYDSTRYLLEASDKTKIVSWKKDNPDAAIWKHVFSENLPDQTKLFLKRLKVDDFDAYFRKRTGHSVSFTEGGKHVCSFAKAYGISNEVSDIVRQIQKDQIPYGDVSVYYPNEDYEAYLDAEFSSRSVPLTFSNGRDPKGSEYFRIARGILEWAENGFYYDQLRPVFSSGILDYQKNGSPGYWYEQEMKAGVGLGLSRYYDYAKIIQDDFDKHGLKGKKKEDLEGEEKSLFNRKILADYLRGLANIFNGNPVSEEDLAKGNYTDIQSPDSSQIYRNMIQWLDEFTRKSSPDKERSDYLSLLKDQLPEMDLVHITDLSESCGFLLDELDHLRISDPDRPDAVRAVRVNQYRIENRKHVWFISLSVNEIESAKTDSPVLTDDELKKYLKSPVSLASDYARNMRKSLEHTLSTIRGKAKLTYTYYETNTLLDWNPSSFYLDKMEELNGSEERIAPEDDFTKSVIFTRPDDQRVPVTNDLLSKWLAEADPKTNQKLHTFSASSAQDLLTCQIKFYYKRILGIHEQEEPELNYDEWLDSKYRGNMFHKVLERYAKACLIGENEQKTFNQEAFDKIYEEEAANAETGHTCLNDKVKEAEKEEYRQILTTYLKKLHQEVAEQGWHVGGAETEIGPYPLNEKFDRIIFTGTIDRFDYKTDKDGNITDLRIVDYKTSRRHHLEEELDKGLRIQHAVYMELLKKESEKQKKPVRDDALYFEYDLIYEDPQNLEPIRKPYYSGESYADAETLDRNVNDFGPYPAARDSQDSDCRFCPYRKLCGKYGK